MCDIAYQTLVHGTYIRLDGNSEYCYARMKIDRSSRRNKSDLRLLSI